jgi:hypothetical protein
VDNQRRQQGQGFGQLQLERLEERETPSIVLYNPAGNTPQSETANNGVAVEALNPAGKAPGGHNK